MALVESDYTRMKKGAKAPDFSLIGTDGETYSLTSFKGAKALLVIFMCNHCPYVVPKIDEMIRIQRDFGPKGLKVVGINPNDDKTYPADSFENMRKMVKEKGINFPYLRDETQEIARGYSASCTPDPFLFESEFKLVFHSRIDDSHGSDPATKHEMHNAISEFLEKGSISLKEKPSMGCSIKWK